MAERQLAACLDDIRSDHVERYKYAADIVRGRVLDAACGCGYGAALMASSTLCSQVLAVDYSEDALSYARETWYSDKILYRQANLLAPAFEGDFDWLVSFETIEHLRDPVPFLMCAVQKCRRFVCSVPNEEVIPFDPKRFDFHCRHYTRDDIAGLLKSCGFEILRVQYQRSAQAEGFNDINGRTILIEGCGLAR